MCTAYSLLATLNNYSGELNMYLAKHTPRSDIHPAQQQPGVRFGFIIRKIMFRRLHSHTWLHEHVRAFPFDVLRLQEGFSNWKDATVSFKRHLQCKCHIEAVEAVVTLPKTTKDVGEQLSRAHRQEKEHARDMLHLIFTSVQFLARQGLALREDGSGASANLIQLLRLRWQASIRKRVFNN